MGRKARWRESPPGVTAARGRCSNPPARAPYRDQPRGRSCMHRPLIAHMGANRWLWAGIMAVIALVAWLLRETIGTGYHLGDITALALMIVGMLVILQSQEGYNPPRMEV